ncbi:MAG: hypothetical protein R3B70_27915 [Polyangiaceae bacterium]
MIEATKNEGSGAERSNIGRGKIATGPVPPAAFEARLRDLLSTLEASALVGAAEGRMRGLGEHLRFACMAIPASEALVALEQSALGRLHVPVVADASGFRACNVEFLPSGTPFSYLLAGGSGHAARLSEGDPMIAPLAPALSAPPVSGMFLPIRVNDTVAGGIALFAHEEPFTDRQLEMGERLSEVLALTVESFRTERVLFELFARALPDVIGGMPTSFAAALSRYIHAMRLPPAYRRRLTLAAAVSRVADRGEAEAELVIDLLDRIDRYAKSLTGMGFDEGAEGL